MYSYTHGGDIYSLEGEVLDFSANINPYGLPQGVKDAMIKAVDGCDIYPDPFCRELRTAISKLEGIPPEYIFCSNGAADMIYRIVTSLKPKRALLAVPSFTEYEEALNTVDCTIDYFYMTSEEGYALSQRYLEYLSPDLDMIFLCNPNNPTGLVADKGSLEQIIMACERYQITCVLDECFVDFLEESENYTFKNPIKKYSNLIVLKAFTKLYAMAGVRLGYCLTANEISIEKLYLGGQPWAVSHIAQQAGIAATLEKEYLNFSLQMIHRERERLKIGLAELGYHVYDSKANFVFFKAKDGADLKELLLQDRILIRSCENYKGLEKGYYRIAVKNPWENDRLMKSLKKRNEITHG